MNFLQRAAILGVLCPTFVYADPPTTTGSACDSGYCREEIMPNAEKMFYEVQKLIGEKYVDAGISKDALWTGAIRGMLDQLIQVEGIEVNALLSPEDLKELTAGVEGKVTGVGVIIKYVGPVLLVENVIENGPAAKAGVKAGDRILAVDGKPVRGMELGGVVKLIRGVEGSSIDLFLQRETEEWDLKLNRGTVQPDPVTSRMLEGGIGYLEINSFNEVTVGAIDRAFAGPLKGMNRGLVLDLRDCPGGLFDVAVKVADRFLPGGVPIVSVKGRSAQVETRKTNKVKAIDLPIVVLIDADTASGAEMLAAAISDQNSGTLVGEKTLGKGSIETILELSNGWALKLSAARMLRPSGKSWLGVGVEPDIAVQGIDNAKGGAPAMQSNSAEGTARDPQLEAALQLLKVARRP